MADDLIYLEKDGNIGTVVLNRPEKLNAMAPPMLLLFADRPFLLVIIYGAFGALFMPFLAITLLMLNNSDRLPVEARNGVVANVTLAGSAILFIVLAVQQIAKLVA